MKDHDPGKGGTGDEAIRRVGADALESLVLGELARLSGRTGADAAELLALLVRLELRQDETHLVLDQAGLFGCDHPELALEDLQARLRPGERVVVEPGEELKLRVALPRRMQLRGGRSWAVFSSAVAARPRVDPALVGALKRGHQLAATAADLAPESKYERRILQLAYLAPDLQRDILLGRQPPGLTLAKMMAIELPASWTEQRRFVAAQADEGHVLSRPGFCS